MVITTLRLQADLKHKTTLFDFIFTSFSPECLNEWLFELPGMAWNATQVINGKGLLNGVSK